MTSWERKKSTLFEDKERKKSLKSKEGEWIKREANKKITLLKGKERNTYWKGKRVNE